MIVVQKSMGKRKTKSAKKTTQAPKETLPRVKWELVTPKIAEEYLKCNVGNRRLRPKDVERYSSDMGNGRWWLTHQGIAFDDEGNLIDGQHRLMAQIKAGVTLHWLVIRGLPHKASAVVDNNIVRTAQDMAFYLDRDITGPMIGVARCLNEGYRQQSNKLSNLALLEMVDNHRDAILAAIGYLSPREVGITKMPVLAAFARACYHITSHILERLGYVLRTGGPRNSVFEPGEKTMILLRTWLIREGMMRHGRDGRWEIYGKTSRAIQAAALGQDLTKLFSPGAEVFPLPEEEGALTIKPNRRKGKDG